MKKIKGNGRQFGIIRDALLRVNDGVSVSFFLKLKRVEKTLMLSEKLEDTKEYIVDLEDADFDFVRSEWNAANGNKGYNGIWQRSRISVENGMQKLDYLTLMNDILSVEEILNGEQS